MEEIADQGPSKTVREIAKDQIAADTVAADQTTGGLRAHVDRYLVQQARKGRMVDIQSLAAAEVKVEGEGTLTSIAPKDESVEEIAVVRVNEESGIQWAVGVLIVQSAESPPIHSSSGYDGGINPSGMTLQWDTCRSLFWDASYSDSHDHYVYDCVEKWKISDTAWVYNRYTLFDPANSDNWLERDEIVEATIRTRPWKGYESRATGGPYNYAPRPSSTCTTYTATIGFNAASLDIPLVSCNAKISVGPKSTDYSMTTDWSGRTTSQVSIDYAFRIATNGNPYYADYVWLEVQSCYDPIARVSWSAQKEKEKWVDAGW